tara:strand:- start:58 stop:1005 length:948 start_codon:yes stop_codon:yes gene_type:complete
MFPLYVISQQTYIPDNAFEQYLINEGYDNVLDDSVTTANIAGVTTLQMNGGFQVSTIYDLTGLEDFTSLTHLYVRVNQLSAIDVSNLNALEVLQCDDNNLSSLDLSNNHSLTDLFCADNNLSNINLSNNTNLMFLYCERNPITKLYLGNNHNLSQLSARGCSLECLNIRSSNSTPINLYRLWLGQSSFQTDNPNLNCIEVDDTSYYKLQATNPNGSTEFEYIGSFSNNCNNSCSPLNIEHHINKTSIYPNPTKNIIQIEIENNNGRFKVELYGFTGKLLETTNETTISLRNYSKGIYILKVAYGDRVEEFKVIKD